MPPKKPPKIAAVGPGPSMSARRTTARIRRDDACMDPAVAAFWALLTGPPAGDAPAP